MKAKHGCPLFFLLYHNLCTRICTCIYVQIEETADKRGEQNTELPREQNCEYVMEIQCFQPSEIQKLDFQIQQ